MVTSVREVCEQVTEENYVFVASDHHKSKTKNWIT
jgi:hypothetical protein